MQQKSNMLEKKNIIVAGLTLVIVSLMAITAMGGRAYHGGQHGKIIEDITKNTIVPASSPDSNMVATQEQKDEQQEELKAIKDKAGSSATNIVVSVEYKSKCSACHADDGSGYQEGRKLMGPKLYGQSAEKIYKDLVDFKAGRKENVIMKGLLINTSEEELKKFADEIGAFSSQTKK